MNSSNESLADIFRRLSKEAYPGEWIADGAYIMPKGSLHDRVATAQVSNTRNSSETAEFIAFCGTHRDQILRALRLLEMCEFPSEKLIGDLSLRCFSLNGTDVASNFIAALLQALREK